MHVSRFMGGFENSSLLCFDCLSFSRLWSAEVDVGVTRLLPPVDGGSASALVIQMGDSMGGTSLSS